MGKDGRHIQTDGGNQGRRSIIVQNMARKRSGGQPDGCPGYPEHHYYCITSNLKAEISIGVELVPLCASRCTLGELAS
jgi:hypothetical protein